MVTFNLTYSLNKFSYIIICFVVFQMFDIQYCSLLYQVNTFEQWLLNVFLSRSNPFSKKASYFRDHFVIGVQNYEHSDSQCIVSANDSNGNGVWQMTISSFIEFLWHDILDTVIMSFSRQYTLIRSSCHLVDSIHWYSHHVI